MEGARECLEQLRQHQLVKGYMRGLLHALIGRKLSRADGTVLSSGLTWRQLAELLKVIRWDRELVRELGLDPDQLPPRDRQRFWYVAITAAQVDSPDASAAADRLARKTSAIGYAIGAAPT